jgi:hypothetical protein
MPPCASAWRRFGISQVDTTPAAQFARDHVHSSEIGAAALADGYRFDVMRVR